MYGIKIFPNLHYSFFLKIVTLAGCQKLTPIILTPWEAKMRRIEV
jgi:hypothetical protein